MASIYLLVPRESPFPSFPNGGILTTTAMDLRAVAHWVLGRLDTIEHEKRVVRIASSLFDLTRPRHRLSGAARRLLRTAALVHDIGRSVDKARHPAIGAGMILRDHSLHIGMAERRALAFLTLYHRDGVPEIGHEAILRDSDDRKSLRKVLALLRAADALDSRSLESPRIVFSLKKGQLDITCYFQSLTGKARKIYQRRKKFRLLEEELGLEVEVDVRAARALKMVA
jgi:exopolyphosphatase/pppGpp-phosphohydrolase